MHQYTSLGIARGGGGGGVNAAIYQPWNSKGRGVNAPIYQPWNSKGRGG